MCAREIEEDVELGLGQVPRAEDQPIVGDAKPSRVCGAETRYLHRAIDGHAQVVEVLLPRASSAATWRSETGYVHLGG